MKSILLLLRPQQWMKNLFIFSPLFFDGHLMDWNYILPSLYVFVAYCFAASGIYCFNDIWDVEADRKHPSKCKRPIASGIVSILQGYLVMSSMILLSFVVVLISFWHDRQTMLQIGGIILLYLIINVAYCTKLKQIALFDVFVIAVGFVLRVVIGGISSQIWISHWIILMTFLLALFLAFAKRRDDVVLYVETGILVRKNIKRYNLFFMNQVLSVIASITIVCYIMYTVSPDVIQRMGTQNLYLTSIWVILGLMRYLQLTLVDVKSGSPTKILIHDRFIQLTIMCWLFSFLLIIYV